MKTPTNFRNSLPITPHPIKLHVITSRERGNIADLIATTAISGPLTIVAGNEWLPTYAVARMLYRHTTAVRKILNHVHLARAFTCYQMLDILQHTPPIREPFLLINFLFSFDDEDIGMDIRMRVLKGCIKQLKVLSLSRPIALLVQRQSTQQYEQFYPLVEEIAHEIINVESQTGVAPPIRLF